MKFFQVKFAKLEIKGFSADFILAALNSAACSGKQLTDY